MSKSNGTRYTQEFKNDVIKMITEGGRTPSSVAKDLGINEQTVRNWLSSIKKKEDPLVTRISDLENQLKEKERKINDLEMSVDILKKATAIFIQNNNRK